MTEMTHGGQAMKKSFSAPYTFAGISAVLTIPVALILAQPLALSATELTGGIVNGKTDQGYPFASGGVGTEERELMRKEAPRYDLDLSFADQGGKYLSDVKVAITDEHGNRIVETTTAGPWFYITLPVGRYDVKAQLRQPGQGNQKSGSFQESLNHSMVTLGYCQ